MNLASNTAPPRPRARRAWRPSSRSVDGGRSAARLQCCAPSHARTSVGSGLRSRSRIGRGGCPTGPPARVPRASLSRGRIAPFRPLRGHPSPSDPPIRNHGLASSHGSSASYICDICLHHRYRNVRCELIHPAFEIQVDTCLTPRLCRAARALAGFEQKSLADASGVSKSTIGAFEIKEETARVSKMNNHALVQAFEAAEVRANSRKWRRSWRATEGQAAVALPGTWPARSPFRRTRSTSPWCLLAIAKPSVRMHEGSSPGAPKGKAIQAIE